VDGGARGRPAAEARFVRQRDDPMRDVLHSPRLIDAENLRIALLAEGIVGQVHDAGIRSHPTRYTVAVTESDYEAAVAIRARLERDATNAPTQTVPRRTVFAIIVIVAALFWWLWRISAR